MSDPIDKMIEAFTREESLWQQRLWNGNREVLRMGKLIKQDADPAEYDRMRIDAAMRAAVLALADEFKDATPSALAAASATANQFTFFTPADIAEMVHTALLAYSSIAAAKE